MKYEHETHPVGAALTLLLSLASMFVSMVSLEADDCSSFGEAVGPECSGHPLGCSTCIGGTCGLHAQGDGDCYSSCYAAAVPGCS